MLAASVSTVKVAAMFDKDSTGAEIIASLSHVNAFVAYSVQWKVSLSIFVSRLLITPYPLTNLR